jgi:DNA-binding MarR family transcriptional regulator
MSDPKHTSMAWEALFRAQVEIMRRLEADDLMPDLTLKEYDVLYTLRLAGGDGLRLKELNKGVLMHQSALSRLVERLELRGLVARQTAPDDRRGTLITLTVEGIRLQREMGRRHVAQIDHYVGSALSPRELEQMRVLTEKLKNAQEAIPRFNTREAH